MGNSIRTLVLIAFALTIALFIPRASVGQNNEHRHFPETGKTVEGDFYYSYMGAKDPVRIYGYPITNAYTDPETGNTVQYFHRAHFEFITSNPPEMQVQRTLLGQILYEPGLALTSPINSPACRQFAETNQYVCYAFLEFFDAYGGISQFGLPISGIEIHNERMVQYFQRARFEWHPEYPSGERVTLTDLGRFYFDKNQENPSLLLDLQESYIPQIILQLKVNAFVDRAVTHALDQQTLYVVVQDQNYSPIARARVVFQVRYPGGQENFYIMPITNQYGITSMPFKVPDEGNRLAEISVSVEFNKFEKQTRSSFRIWH
jgi:hypothetical protein